MAPNKTRLWGEVFDLVSLLVLLIGLAALAAALIS